MNFRTTSHLPPGLQSAYGADDVDDADDADDADGADGADDVLDRRKEL